MSDHRTLGRVSSTSPAMISRNLASSLALAPTLPVHVFISLYLLDPICAGASECEAPRFVTGHSPGACCEAVGAAAGNTRGVGGPLPDLAETMRCGGRGELAPAPGDSRSCNLRLHTVSCCRVQDAPSIVDAAGAPR